MCIRDSINAEYMGDDNFFEIFSPVFEKNSQFSKNQKVPKLGSNTDPIASVEEFYNFWDNFKSWRDFSLYAEYDLNEAESRLEKRWMAKENKKLTEKFVKEERARINKLVSLAKKHDPRVKKEMKRIEKEKEKSRLEKQKKKEAELALKQQNCLLYTSPSPRDLSTSRMPSSA
eukprot:TRINITY_DN7280_c0_g1_i4.p3 TRINITY_DN7280_c0_g1~~TRINITY_DN7280_c0_g1_i4.p3  ORF type:complete len:173 (-),score=53.07 TRINITY_DN7280_c0_g1_i4:25-543(-)